LPRIKLASPKTGTKSPSEMMGFFCCAKTFPPPDLNINRLQKNGHLLRYPAASLSRRRGK